MEICVVKPANVTEYVSEDVIQGIVDKINQEKEAKEAEKKAKSAAAKWDKNNSNPQSSLSNCKNKHSEK